MWKNIYCPRAQDWAFELYFSSTLRRLRLTSDELLNIRKYGKCAFSSLSIPPSWHIPLSPERDREQSLLPLQFNFPNIICSVLNHCSVVQCSSSSSSSSFISLSLSPLRVCSVWIMPPGTSSQTVNHRRAKYSNSKINKKTFFIHFVGIKKQFKLRARHSIVVRLPNTAVGGAISSILHAKLRWVREVGCTFYWRPWMNGNRINVNWRVRRTLFWFEFSFRRHGFLMGAT